MDATDAEKSYASILSTIHQSRQGECCYCNHCLPCPSMIDVGQTLRLVDRAEFAVTPDMRAEYNALPAKAFECIECGDCTGRCPFGVDVISKMRRAAEIFE